MKMKDEEQEKEILKPQRTRKWSNLDKRNCFYALILHGIGVLAPFHFNWTAFFIAITLYIFSGLGITLSYHRNLTHKSFKLPKWLEYFFAYCGVHAFQGDPIDWVSIHRHHHKYVDTEKDSHSPIDGFWFSHLGWVMNSSYLTKRVNPKYISREVEEQDRNILMLNFKYGSSDNVGDLEKQKFYQFLRKTYILHPIALAIALYAMGGLPFLIWGMAVRISCVIHSTCMVNSVCHIWGKQPWNTGDLSRNNWFVGVVALGEGWHNNHHAFEYSAKHGFEWWQFDFTWQVIQFLQFVGLATDVKLPSEKQKQAKNKSNCGFPTAFVLKD